MRYFSLVMLFWAVALVVGQAAITPDQQKKVSATAAMLTKMDALVKAEKYDEVLKLLPDVQTAVTELATIPELAAPVANVIKRIEGVRGDLELQGLTLPEFKKTRDGQASAEAGSDADARGGHSGWDTDGWGTGRWRGQLRQASRAVSDCQVRQLPRHGSKRRTQLRQLRSP